MCIICERMGLSIPFIELISGCESDAKLTDFRKIFIVTSLTPKSVLSTMAPTIAGMSKKQEAALKKAGKWFPFAGKAYASAAARSAAQKAAGGSVPARRSGGPSRGPKVNTSGLFWAAHPGSRENVKHTITMELAPDSLSDAKFFVNLAGSDAVHNVPTAVPPIPAVFELVSLKIKFAVPVLVDVKIQALAMLLKSVSQASRVTWDGIVELPRVSKFSDVHSIMSVDSIPVTKAVNSSGGDAAGVLAILFRVAGNEDTKMVKIVVEVVTSQLKAGVNTLEF